MAYVLKDNRTLNRLNEERDLLQVLNNPFVKVNIFSSHFQWIAYCSWI